MNPILNAKEEQNSEIFRAFQDKDLERALQSKALKEQIKGILDGTDLHISSKIEERDGKRSRSKMLYEIIIELVKELTTSSSNKNARYSNANYRRLSNPRNSACHYIEAAKVTALTERQIQRIMKELCHITPDSTNPYAAIPSIPHSENQAQKKRLKVKKEKPKKEIMNKRNSIRFGKSNDLDRQTAVPECGKNIIRRKSEGKEKLKRDFDFDDHLFIRQHAAKVTANFHRGIRNDMQRAAERQYQTLAFDEIKLKHMRKNLHTAFLVYSRDKKLPKSFISSKSSQINPPFVTRVW